MTDQPNKLNKFWHELKRRKVIGVIIVYVPTAFILMEAANLFEEALNLPSWFDTVITIALIIGFPIAIIFSWIFDVSSKGIIKTEPELSLEKAPESKTEEKVSEERFSHIANSIAVLPFQDMSSEKDQEYFCDGIAEEIINALAHVSSLKVIARTSAFAFKNQNVDMREIGQTLNVETLLEGSIRKDSNRIRITAQLIRTDDGTHLWSERFDRNLDDIFAIQDEISMAIVDHLKIKLLSQEKSAILKRYTDDFELYDLYLKAVHYSKLATPAAIETAVDYIGKALQKDPQFIYGYAALGLINAFSTNYGNLPPNIGYPKAKEYGEKILELDNNSAEGHAIIAGYSLFYDWNWDTSEQQFKHALQLNPNHEWNHLLYSQNLIFTGRNSEGILEAKRAMELDPLSGFFHANLGLMYTYSGQFGLAIDHLRQTIEKFPDFYMGHWFLGDAYLCASKPEEAIEKCRKAVELSGGIPMVDSTLAIALYVSGKTEEAGHIIKALELRSEKEYVPASCFTYYYRYKGDFEKLDRLVDRAIHDHDIYLPYLLIHPIKELRYQLDEQKYPDLIKKMKLKERFKEDYL